MNDNQRDYQRLIDVCDTLRIELVEARAEIARLKAQLAPLSKCQEAACAYVVYMGQCDRREYVGGYDDNDNPYCDDAGCVYCNLASSLDEHQHPRQHE